MQAIICIGKTIAIGASVANHLPTSYIIKELLRSSALSHIMLHQGSIVIFHGESCKLKIASLWGKLSSRRAAACCRH